MQRQALAALDAARPAIARLDRGRNAEDLAADLIEAWSAIETALRSLLGGSALSGQALIREARGRQLISFDQANSLAEFNAARDRAQNTQYHPSEADINSAREAFLKLESGLMTPAAPGPVTPPVDELSTMGMRKSPLGIPMPVPPPGRQPWWLLVAGLVIVAALALGAWALWGRRESSLEVGVAAWQRGQRELAIGEFTRAARENPQSALPHIYLSRLARESGNLTLATQEATQAVQLEPRNPTAMREMAAVSLATGNYELARRFYVRTLELAPDDRTAQGFLGCALIRLGRHDEGLRWMNRAGQGSWSGCAQAAPQPGAVPPMGPIGIPR